MNDFSNITNLTFDCYGTLVDWEAGILGALRPFAARAAQPPEDRALLACYGELERDIESGEFRPYREVLSRVMRGMADRFGFALGAGEEGTLAQSLPTWPAFADTAAALRRLHTRFKLGVLSNIDDDLLEQTRRHADLTIDWAVTAQQCRSYKPASAHFTTALARHGLTPDRVLHVASSIGHDIAPASALGIATVHLHRRAGREGPGANGPGMARPTHTVTDFASLLTLLHL